nr:hypothetical protein CFP56_56678 [Quercus suber]
MSGGGGTAFMSGSGGTTWIRMWNGVWSLLLAWSLLSRRGLGVELWSLLSRMRFFITRGANLFFNIITLDLMPS